MKRNARLWIGVTVLTIILVNYILIGVPLLSKSRSIQGRAKTILMKQIKSGSIFSTSDDEYMLEIFRKEKATIDTKVMVLNGIAVTLAFIAGSWTIFGLIFKGK